MPMGWDAFGLPAENAAMQSGVPPAKWTYDNIAYMKQQMQSMGWAIDWSRELATCKPDYYRWNQWLFLKMLEKGIAYKKSGVVNWDPVDQTVLANEQVIDGRGWRSGAPVEKREIPMYYLRITDYADELLDNLDQHDRLARARAHHAGQLDRQKRRRSLRVHCMTSAATTGSSIDDGKLWVFTTRADTIMGVTFCAVAAEHPLATHAARSDARRSPPSSTNASTAASSRPTSRRWKRRACRPGLFVIHPLSGEMVPVWVGNYVLMSYGDGAVMGVPGHDERDFEFAKQIRAADQAGHRGARRAGQALPTRPTLGRAGTRTRNTAPTCTPASTTG